MFTERLLHTQTFIAFTHQEHQYKGPLQSLLQWLWLSSAKIKWTDHYDCGVTFPVCMLGSSSEQCGSNVSIWYNIIFHLERTAKCSKTAFLHSFFKILKCNDANIASSNLITALLYCSLRGLYFYAWFTCSVLSMM